jgi:signal peptide peptidase SppA
MIHNAQCFANHLGPWAIESSFLRGALGAIRSGLAVPAAAKWTQPMMAGKTVMDPMSNPEAPEVLYTISDKGVGCVQVCGPMMKARSKFGGCSTVQTRRAIRAMVADKDVSAIMVVLDTPGGTVAGTAELGDDVAAAGKVKPTYAYAADQCCSAGYWVASQAHAISANASAMVGSIGTIMVLEDTSGQAAAEGIKVHVLSTGPMKGAAADGTEITPEQVSYFQGIIDQMGAQFFATVRAGRNHMTDKRMAEITSGKVWMAADALKLGLIDTIQSFDAAMAEAGKAGAEATRAARQRARAASAAIRLAEIE